MLKHFVEFLYPGAQGSSQFKEVEERDAKTITVPVEASGYRFYDQEYDIEKQELIGEKKNYSGCTYYGKVYTFEELKKEHEKNIDILFNMLLNECEKIVKTRTGHWAKLQRWDTVIEEE